VAETGADIPDRAFFKASEVCEIARVQSYVLRSWEQEFRDLGVERTSGGSRVYRRADVERVLRIKHLLFVEGLTLAGAKRRLSEERGAASEADEPLPVEGLNAAAQQRLEGIKQGLRSLLDMLDQAPPGTVPCAAPPWGPRPAPEPPAGGTVKSTGRRRRG
jgi:DNA-binding transcriptional MerR regulator